MTPMSVAALHAYRVANRGDGWLVDLTRQLVEEATGHRPTIYALDPTGMPDPAVQVLGPPTRIRALFSAALASAGARTPARLVAGLPRPAQLDLVVGVGGAYLRANDRRHEMVFRAHHLPQLQLAGALGVRAIYLPVSIGPLPPRLLRLVQRLLSNVGTVCVRDDRSAALISDHPRVVRLPDIAACAIGASGVVERELDPGAATVAIRELPGSSVGTRLCSELRKAGIAVEMAIQSDAGHTNDDRAFYERQGIQDAAPLAEILEREPAPGVAIAGRLHAALACIAAGIPAIHLGYERKSWGAYDDLGLGRWLFHAWSSDPREVSSAACDLLQDPTEYWQALDANRSQLAAGWSELVRLVGQAASGGRG